MSRFIDEGELPNFRRLRAQSTLYTTDACGNARFQSEPLLAPILGDRKIKGRPQRSVWDRKFEVDSALPGHAGLSDAILGQLVSGRRLEPSSAGPQGRSSKRPEPPHSTSSRPIASVPVGTMRRACPEDHQQIQRLPNFNATAEVTAVGVRRRFVSATWYGAGENMNSYYRLDVRSEAAVKRHGSCT